MPSEATARQNHQAVLAYCVGLSRRLEECVKRHSVREYFSDEDLVEISRMGDDRLTDFACAVLERSFLSSKPVTVHRGVRFRLRPRQLDPENLVGLPPKMLQHINARLNRAREAVQTAVGAFEAREIAEARKEGNRQIA